MIFFMIRLRLSIFGKDAIISGSMMSIGYLTGDVHFDHLVKVVSAVFFHYKVTIFLFVINKWRKFLLTLKCSRRLLFNQQAH